MAAYLPRLMPSATDAVDLPGDFFQRRRRCAKRLQHLAGSHDQSRLRRCSYRQRDVWRVLCRQTFRDTNVKRLRTLLLEAGPFLVAEHFQDLPDIGLNVPEPIDPTNDGGLPREFVWEMPWRGNTSFVGTPYCVGGKSVYWAGWCPRLTDGDLAAWPPRCSSISEKQLCRARAAARRVGNRRFHSRAAM
jgi:hypothetical protein